jgi:LacI family transcriptional regulator, galactose operon repressor
MPALQASRSRPTMRDVAREAQVSLKTVSRVVNDEGGVRPETAARVAAAITELGFRRNDMARVLRQGQASRTIGLVIEDVANPFYSAITRAAEEVARKRGYLVITGSSDEDPAGERELLRLLCERRVDGLLVVPAGGDHRFLIPELRMGTAAVFMDRPADNLEADTILIDNVGGARRAVGHLLAHGHRRIGMVGDAWTIFTAAERRRGYLDALAAAGVPVDQALLRLGSHDVVAAEAAARALLALPDPPTAIFAGNNRITIGVLRAIRASGGRTALVGFDDFELADVLSITVVAHSPAEMGRQAAELLCRRLDGERSPPQRIVLPATLVPRGSGELWP